MPYLTKEVKDIINIPTSSGELNYMLTELIIAYIIHNGGLNYNNCNDVVGALDNAKHEFRRRVQDLYEDKKCKKSGDVYPHQFII